MYDLNVGDVLGNTWVGFPPFSHQRSLNLTNKPKRGVLQAEINQTFVHGKQAHSLTCLTEVMHK